MHLGITVKFTHMPLGLVPEIFNSVDVICLVCKQFGMVDMEVFKVRYFQHIIPSPAVRIYDTIEYNFTFYNRI